MVLLWPPAKKDIQRVKGSLRDLLRDTDTLDVRRLEHETGVNSAILRRTLIILLGEGTIQGTLSGDEFILEKKQDINDFERELVDELWNPDNPRRNH